MDLIILLLYCVFSLINLLNIWQFRNNLKVNVVWDGYRHTSWLPLYTCMMATSAQWRLPFYTSNATASFMKCMTATSVWQRLVRLPSFRDSRHTHYYHRPSGWRRAFVIHVCERQQGSLSWFFTSFHCTVICFVFYAPYFHACFVCQKYHIGLKRSFK